MKTITVILVLLLFFTKMCIGQSPKVIRIDPSSAIGGTVSGVFQRVKYIPLETTKESLFGKIDQLIVYDKYFFILDIETNSILIFEKDGKFHAKIYGGSGSLNAMNAIVSFTVDKEKKVVEFRRFGRPKSYLSHYDFDGKLLEKSKQDIYHPYRLFQLPNGQTGYYNYYTGDKFKDSIAYEITIYDSADRLKKGFFPYNQKTAEVQSNDILTSAMMPFFKKSASDSSFFYVRPYDYNIYTLSPTRLDTSFHFIFPLRYSLPSDYRTNPDFNGKRNKYFMDYKDMIYDISYTYQIGNNLLFSLATWGGLQNADYYLYNLKTGRLMCMNKISPDSLNSYLPIANITSVMGRNFAYSDGISLYSSVSSLKMFASLEDSKERSVIYPSILQKYFSTQSRKSNPVIVQLELMRD